MGERLAAIIRAWRVFASGHKLKPENVRLDYHRNYNDDKTIDSFYALVDERDGIGGIDVQEPEEEIEDGGATDGMAPE